MPVISRFVELKITNQGKYYEALGYGHIKQGTLVCVPIQDLPKNSNKLVQCSCDRCASLFERNYQKTTQTDECLCSICARVRVGEINVVKQTGVARPWQVGENHPRWRTDKSEFANYCRLVTRFTNSYKHIWSTWENFDKIGRCGVEGAYQLDHIISKYHGFENGIPPEQIGDIQNLQIIPWLDNRIKGHKYT